MKKWNRDDEWGTEAYTSSQESNEKSKVSLRKRINEEIIPNLLIKFIIPCCVIAGLIGIIYYGRSARLQAETSGQTAQHDALAAEPTKYQKYIGGIPMLTFERLDDEIAENGENVEEAYIGDSEGTLPTGQDFVYIDLPSMAEDSEYLINCRFPNQLKAEIENGDHHFTVNVDYSFKVSQLTPAPKIRPDRRVGVISVEILNHDSKTSYSIEGKFKAADDELCLKHSMGKGASLYSVKECFEADCLKFSLYTSALDDAGPKETKNTSHGAFQVTWKVQGDENLNPKLSTGTEQGDENLNPELSTGAEQGIKNPDPELSMGAGCDYGGAEPKVVPTNPKDE